MRMVVQRVDAAATVVIGDSDRHTRRCGRCATTLAQPNGWICNECGFDDNKRDWCLARVPSVHVGGDLPCINYQEFNSEFCQDHQDERIQKMLDHSL